MSTIDRAPGQPNEADEKKVALSREDEIANPMQAEVESVEAGKILLAKGADEAQAFAGAEAIVVDEETNRRIRHKIDWHMLPIMGGLYCLQYLDKTVLSFASAMNLEPDLGINSAQYAWAGSIFYIGFLAFEYPHNRMMQVLPIGKYMSVAVMVWGAILCFSALVHNDAGILAARFFLGAMEGAITAGFVLITSAWYRSSEQTFRTAIWFSCNGIAQIIGGFIAYGVARGVQANDNIHLAAWKFLFVIVGSFTFLYGIMMWFFLADSPIRARWFNEDEKRLAIERLRGNQQGIGSRVFKWSHIKEVFTDVRTYILFLFTVTINIPNGGVTIFFTQLIQSYGFDAQTTFLLSTPAGFVQIITNLGIPYLAGRYGQRMMGAIAGMLISLLGIALMAGLAMNNHPLNGVIGQLIGYYLLISTSSVGLILILSLVATNTAGYTKKTTTNAITLIGYCTGFLIGPQCFRDPPYYYKAKYNIVAMWTVTTICCIAFYVINKRENKKRDREWEAAGRPPQPPGQEFLDLTDKENRYFRYAL